MVKYFSLDSLSEAMGDGKEAKELENKITSDQLFKIYDWVAFYLEDDEQIILDKYSEIKHHYINNNLLLHDFEDFAEGFEWNLKNFKTLQINESELLDYAQDVWNDIEEWQDGIMITEDIKKYFDEINNIIFNNFISIQLNFIFQEIKNNNIEIDWNLAGLHYVKEEA